MELDNSTFQLVTMALLGVTLLVLVMTLVSLNKLGKKVDEGLTSRSEPGPQQWDREETQQQLEAPSPQEQPARRPEPEEGDAGPTEEPVAQTWDYRATAQAEPAAQQAAPADADSSAQPSEQGDDRTPVAEPKAAATGGGQSPEAAEQQPEQQPEAATSFENAPEEQPFEHGGRWWFKRGDELLVYDEQSGQWEPAPAEGMGQASSGQPQGAGPAQQQETASPQQAADQPPEEASQGTFWKCPSCGAVNGSTAASCRMCFTPRP